MTGSAVERLVPEPLTGNLSRIEREQLDAQRVGVAAAMAFGSGALMVKEDQGSAWGPAGREGPLVQVQGERGLGVHHTLVGVVLLLLVTAQLLPRSW